MKKMISLAILLSVLFSACTSSTKTIPESTEEAVPTAETKEAEDQTPKEAPTPTPAAILVNSTDDSGPGSLRQALLEMQSGDIIQFDPTVFPPDAPGVISVETELPHLNVDHVTLDARQAGVILDGRQVRGDWTAGLQIVDSSNISIQGLVIQRFPGPGILFSGVSNSNTILGNQLIENLRGIDMEWAEAADNTIAGNLVGTDAEGLAQLGNHGIGVLIGESATGNVIGPDNIIAFNDADGLYLHPVVVEENTTFSNSLFGNVYSNQLVVTEAILVPPVILDFNFVAGDASGSACADCRVRLFSMETGREFNYEGETTADSSGEFNFSKGSAFSGPALMTQAVTPNGRLSAFSDPMQGEAYSLVFQMNNTQPRIQLPQEHSRDLTDNHLSAQFDALGLQQPIYDLEIYPQGLTRARVAMDGIEPQQVIWDLPELEIHPLHEAVINRLVNNGIIITYVLMFWDKETYPNGEGAPCQRFQTEEEVDRFLEYVRFIVGHFKGRVPFYEIWNEPDILNFCPKAIRVDDYINLVQKTVPVIRETDPDAKIVIGGVSNTRFGAYDYLLALLKNGEIMPLVDVISFHPNYGASPEHPENQAYYANYANMLQDFKNTAEANGFRGEYRADEITYRTPENAMEDQPWTYSTIASNKYFLRSVLTNLSLGVSSGLGMPYAVTPFLCTLLDGAQPVPLETRVETSPGVDLQQTSFSLPDGSVLLGVWREGIAKDFDEGIEATLLIQGAQAAQVTVIDLLLGVEQELTAEVLDGNLVIDGLMIKDYPLMIKLWDLQLK